MTDNTKMHFRSTNLQSLYQTIWIHSRRIMFESPSSSSRGKPSNKCCSASRGIFWIEGDLSSVWVITPALLLKLSEYDLDNFRILYPIESKIPFHNVWPIHSRTDRRTEYTQPTKMSKRWIQITSRYKTVPLNYKLSLSVFNMNCNLQMPILFQDTVIPLVLYMSRTIFSMFNIIAW